MASAPSPSVTGSPSGIGRAALVGALIGFFVVLILISAIVVAAGGGIGSGLGAGGFVALWGGPGFGAMFGAVLHTGITEH